MSTVPPELGNQIRVGLLLDSFEVPAWIARIVEQLTDAGFLAVSLVVLNAEPPQRRRRLSRLRAPRRQHLLFNLYRRADERSFGGEPNAFERVDIAQLLSGVPALSAVPVRPKPYEHRFRAGDIDGIRAAELDVILRFGFNIIRGDILSCAHFGVWSYHHGDSRMYRGAPDFFWEMYEGNPVTGTVLQVLTEELDGGRILYRSFGATDPTSLYRGRNAAYWKTAEFVRRCLTDLHQHGWRQLQAKPEYQERTEYRRGIYRTPTNGQMLIFLGRLARGMASRQLYKRIFRDTWYVGYRHLDGKGSGLPVVTSASADRRGGTFRTLVPPAGRYYADPFVVENGGEHHLFFEDFDRSASRGVISSVRLSESGPVNGSTLALERPYHLSYPCVFKANGTWYMVPETRERRSVELFSAASFPDRWIATRVLLSDLDAVDPTVFEHAGRFWLFVNIAVRSASVMDELHLFYADAPEAEWRPHPRNPIVSDVRRARPAGHVVRCNGEIIRPSQDCSRRYGGAVVFNRVTQLTPTDYSEQPIRWLNPGWLEGTLGTHTFNADSEFEVVDGERRTVRPLSWATERVGRPRRR